MDNPYTPHQHTYFPYNPPSATPAAPPAEYPYQQTVAPDYLQACYEEIYRANTQLTTLLSYARNASHDYSPCSKGVYHILSFTPPTLICGLNFIYLGKIWQGLAIQFLAAGLGIIHPLYLVLILIVAYITVFVEHILDALGSSPITDAKKRLLR